MQSIDFQKIKDLREKNGMSQAEVAAYIGMSRPTYASIEVGSNDLAVFQLLRLAEYLRVEPEDLIPGLRAPENGYATFKQLILNCIKWGSDTGDHKITKTKLAKLVYLSDFNWFYKTRSAISGLNYRHIQRGPVADEYFRAIDELFEDQSITIEAKGASLLISSNELAPRDKLSDEQMSLIKDICEAWLPKSTAEIVEFTHQQAPWKTTLPGDLIPYETILSEKNLY